MKVDIYIKEGAPASYYHHLYVKQESCNCSFQFYSSST